MNKNCITTACLLLGICGVVAIGSKVADLTKEIRKIRRRVDKIEFYDAIDTRRVYKLTKRIANVEKQLETEEA